MCIRDSPGAKTYCDKIDKHSYQFKFYCQNYSCRDREGQSNKSHVKLNMYKTQQEKSPLTYGSGKQNIVITLIEQYCCKFTDEGLSLIHISEPTRLLSISYAVFCLKKK